MSDYEYSEEDSYHYSDGDDDYDQEMSDNGGGSDEEMADDINIQIENAYYEAKQFRDDGMSTESIQLFEDVIVMQNERGDELKQLKWTFKALKQLVKMHLQSQAMGSGCEQGIQATLKYYNRLLDYISENASSSSPNGAQGLTPNEVEKGITSLLERVSSLTISHTSSSMMMVGRDTGSDEKLLRDENMRHILLVYEATLRVFKPSTEKEIGQEGICINDRLWFKTNLKLGQLLYELNETIKLQAVIKNLLKNHQLQDSSMEKSSLSSSSSGTSTHLLEIYALQIQLYSRQKDNKKLRELFRRAMRVEGGIPHPRTLALIQELGGKMYMESNEFEAATKSFFQSFKSYDEAGDQSRLRCLKYLVMAGMLDRSAINPFDSQEARPYKDNPEITAMTNLVSAFHDNDIQKFESILRKNEGKIMDDEFIQSHVTDLLRTIRTQVLQSVIAPYTRMTLQFLAESLNSISVDDVQSILVTLILEGKVDGRIDQVKQILIKNCDANQKEEKNRDSLEDFARGKQLGADPLEAPYYDAMNQLTSALNKLSTSISNVNGKGQSRDIMM